MRYRVNDTVCGSMPTQNAVGSPATPHSLTCNFRVEGDDSDPNAPAITVTAGTGANGYEIGDNYYAADAALPVEWAGKTIEVIAVVEMTDGGDVVRVPLEKFVVEPADSMDDVWTGQISVSKGSTSDEYRATWFQDDARVGSGITAPTITVVNVDTGATLVDGETMTQVGSTGVYQWNETTNRLSLGTTYLVTCAATIGGATRTIERLWPLDAQTVS